MLLYLFFKDFIYLFLERGREREREGEKHQCVVASGVHPLQGTWPTTQACALTGNRAGDTLVHRPVLNPLSYTGHGANFVISFNQRFLQCIVQNTS